MRQDERRVPVPAVGLPLRGLRADGTAFPGPQITPGHSAVLRGEIDLIGIVGIDLAAETVAAADADPVLVDRAGLRVRPARAAPGAVILQTAVDLVIAARIDRDMIELTDRQVVEVVPVSGAVVGLVETAIAADNH